jgi:HlyD family secretion protein
MNLRAKFLGSRRAVLPITAALLMLVGASALVLYLRADENVREYQGWVEADLVFVSPDEIGRIETLSVREGSVVEVGAPLFALDDDLQKAAVAENEAAVVNARQTFDRAARLLKTAVGSQKAFDDAEAALRTAEARLNSTKTRLERRRRASPVSGTIEEVYFRGGEMVEPGRPIVSILPPGNVKVRFFVPQSELPKLSLGERVRVHCDGCGSDIYARVRFLSAQAEFTPPVIYSLEERARLVFRVEAIPEHPEELRIGQPVSVAVTGQQAPETSHAQR